MRALRIEATRRIFNVRQLHKKIVDRFRRGRISALERIANSGYITRIINIRDLPDRGITFTAFRKLVNNIADTAIVNKDRLVASEHIVRVKYFTASTQSDLR